MDQKLSFITLGVKDLEQSIHFYEKQLGWTRSELSNDDLILFQMNGFYLALYPADKLAEDATVNAGGSGFKKFTLSILAKSESEVDDYIRELRKKNVKIIKEPQKVFWGGYSSYVADPDDNLWEIAFNPFL